MFRALVTAALMILHLRNNTLAVGKMWVAGKDDWRVGAQEGGPSWGECSSGGIGGSHPGIKVPDLPQGVRPISHSPGGLREPGGGAPPGWGEYRSGGTGDSHLGIGNFSGPVSSGLEPYCGVKCG